MPSALIDARPWDPPDQVTSPNIPLLPRHLKLPDLFADDLRDAVTGRRLVLGNADVRISYVVAGLPSPIYRNATGDECVFVESGTAVAETVFGSLTVGSGDYVILAAGDDAPMAAGRPLRAYCIEANSHLTPPRRYLSVRGSRP